MWTVESRSKKIAVIKKRKIKLKTDKNLNPTEPGMKTKYSVKLRELIKYIVHCI